MKSRKFLLVFLVLFSYFSPERTCFADRASESFEAKTTPDKPSLPTNSGEGFTINFNNVPVLELVKFISKIGAVNFIYDEENLNFNVSIVSEEPTALVNVMGAFIQVLRLNGLDLIEQGNNLVISKGAAVKQIATVVSAEVPLKGETVPPIMTRVFKVKNANPATLAGIIGPLLSSNAIIEVSETTRHIIVTDITQNIEEINKLFYSLDIPKSALEIDSYMVRNNSPDNLISLANQILIPISEGNPLIFVPQESTNTIFIVSTPFLIEKSIALIEDLDSPPSLSRGIRGPLTSQNILIYHIKHKPADVLQEGIQGIEANLEEMGPSSQNLVQTLQSMKFVKQSHSLLFTGDETSIEEVRNILNGLDVPYSEEELEYIKGGFYLYKIQNGDEEQIARSLEKLIQNMKKAPYPDNDLIETIESMKWIKENNSLMFTGDQRSLNQLKQLLPKFDVGKHEVSNLPPSSDFFIYTPKNETPEALYKEIQETYTSLKNSNLSDAAFLNALGSAKVSKSQGTITFTGDPQSLSRIRSLVTMMDKGPVSEKSSTYIYHIQYVSPSRIETGLQKIAKSLPSDQSLGEVVDNMKYISESHTLVFKGHINAINQIKDILPSLDNQEIANESKLTYFVYKLQNAPGSIVLSELEQTAKTIKGSDVESKELIFSINSIKWIESSNSLVITGPPTVIDQIKTLIEKYDHAQAAISSSTYIYHIQYVSPSRIETGLQKIAKSLSSDAAFGKAIDNMKYISESNTLVFKGHVNAINQIKEILPSLDNQEIANESKLTYFVYKLQNAPGSIVLNELEQTAKTIKGSDVESKELIFSINNTKWIESSNSLVITGTPTVIDQIKALIGKYDHPQTATASSSSFYVYKPVGDLPKAFQEKVIAAAKEMERAGLQDPSLIKAMKSATLVSNGSAIMFTGTPEAINKIREIAPTFDANQQATAFFMYKPTSISPEKLIEGIKRSANQLQDSGLKDPDLIQAMQSAKLSSDRSQVVFTGTPAAIEKVKLLVGQYDSLQRESQATEYYIFKPQNEKPEVIIKQAKHAADQMKDAKLADPNLINALNSATIVSNGTGVLFTGTPDAITRLKEIVPTFDIAIETGPASNEFFVYKPTHISADDLRRHARMVADDMESSGLADAGLIKTLRNTRLVSNGKGVLFTGTESSIERVKRLLPLLDTPSDDQVKQVGKTTFQIYKIKYLTGPALMGYLKNMASDLKRAGSTQEDLLTALNNMRYVQDTNSIIFTGTPSAVQEAVNLAQKFDIPSLAQEAPARSPSGYQIYKPKFVPGEELIRILRDFEQNLMTSGVTDKNLFDVINNLKWMEKTSSILISGDDDDTKKVYGLLERFDVPGPGIPEGETGIETVSDMSFLIYKLQYHNGGEIQDAIKLIGEDLGKSKTKVNDNLVDTINTLQWIEVTNSLIATGQADALGKLKELIKSIDVPLKQVFVEILVIETTLSNNLEFGLRWGSQGQYRNKFSYATGGFPSTIGGVTDPLINFQNNLSQISATTTPTGSFIPFSSGGDLGVIGDIILHKGQSYFALGSLINALRDEGDSIVVMNQKIVTQDNKMSTIFVGQNIPYTGSFVSNQSTSTVTTSNIEYRDVGVSLSITPVVGNNDIVTLMIEEDISETQNQDQTSTVSNVTVTGITTNKSSTKTVVSVPDKSFLVLSGSVQDTKVYHRTGIPCLGGLPLIGAAFSDNEKNDNISNLVIFVRPHIIKSFDVYKEITERQEDIFRSQTNAEDFDAGLELVKSPDDTY